MTLALVEEVAARNESSPIAGFLYALYPLSKVCFTNAEHREYE